MIRGNQLKNPRAKHGCILCWNMGSASPAFAYVNVPYAPKFSKVVVELSLAVCFGHCRARKEDEEAPDSKGNNGIIDPNFGQWLNPFTRVEKTGGGGIPIRDQEYRLVGDEVTLITGIAGRIPGMNAARLNRNNDGTWEESLHNRWAKVQQARAAAKVKRNEGITARVAEAAKIRTIGKDDK